MREARRAKVRFSNEGTNHPRSDSLVIDNVEHLGQKGLFAGGAGRLSAVSLCAAQLADVAKATHGSAASSGRLSGPHRSY